MHACAYVCELDTSYGVFSESHKVLNTFMTNLNKYVLRYVSMCVHIYIYASMYVCMHACKN